MAAKDEILLKLQQNRGSYLSGQIMADELSISRNAVWKAIDRLKAEGFAILSGADGYMLSADSDRLLLSHIKQLLSDSPANDKTQNGAGSIAASPDIPALYVFETIDSTNNECKRRLPEENGDFVVLSEEQTEGRGRGGKAFYSPAEKGLYMSIALKRDFPLEGAMLITSFAAVCVVEAIRKLTGLSCQIKWVNDVFYQNRKICGILTEAVTDMEAGAVSHLIVGIGIDLHSADLPEELQGIAGALDCGAVKNELASELIRRIISYDPSDRSFLSAYRAYSLVLGRPVSFYDKGTLMHGTASAIDDDGSLIVSTAEGLRTLRSGEISIRL